MAGQGQQPQAQQAAGGGGTTQKHDTFLKVPLGDKSVWTLPGIGSQLGGRLIKNGVKASYVVGQYLVLNKDEAAFKLWLQKNTCANEKQQKECHDAVSEWCTKFIKGTTQTHDAFVNEPLGIKPVTALPGIERQLGDNLTNLGMKASYVVGQYLVMNKDKVEFKKWLKENADANEKQQKECHDAVSVWCTNFIKGTTQKHDTFVKVPLGDKSVRALPGIGKQVGVCLINHGVKASYVVGQYLVLNKDETAFRTWLKEKAGANKKQQKECHAAVSEWCDKFID